MFTIEWSIESGREDVYPPPWQHYHFLGEVRNAEGGRGGSKIQVLRISTWGTVDDFVVNANRSRRASTREIVQRYPREDC